MKHFKRFAVGNAVLVIAVTTVGLIVNCAPYWREMSFFFIYLSATYLMGRNILSKSSL